MRLEDAVNSKMADFRAYRMHPDRATILVNRSEPPSKLLADYLTVLCQKPVLVGMYSACYGSNQKPNTNALLAPWMRAVMERASDDARMWRNGAIAMYASHWLGLVGLLPGWKLDSE